MKSVIAQATALVSTLAAFAAPSVSHADVPDFTIHQHYVSPRALGMGNAFTALADDYSAVFYNPAGLARIEEPQINLGIGAGIDANFIKLQKDISDSQGGDVSQTTNLLEQNYGEHYSARVPTLSAFWVRPRWGIAIIPVDLSLELGIHKLATLDVIATQDTTIAYARGWDVNWGADHISMGITGKAIYRGYYNKAIHASELAMDPKLLRAEEAKEGLTVDFDYGMLWTPKLEQESWLRAARPTIGFTVRNIADYGFKQNFHLIDKNSTEAPKIGRRFDLGTLWELPDWWIWKTRAMVDMRDMGHANWTAKKGFHAGVELLWKIRSWWQGGWRVGVNQGYFTGGFTGKFALFNLDLVTYAEEVGPSDNPKSNRRYMLKASLDW